MEAYTCKWLHVHEDRIKCKGKTSQNENRLVKTRFTWELLTVMVQSDSLPCVRGCFWAKGPDSSVGGVPVAHCLGDDHMEEEVQVRVQVEVEREEKRTGETHGK